ncbi:MAG TPA: beta-N-acetylhexosaminidase [Actinomadura sp.]|nr:beta-N-acetylhexosaminidase [Actinomadura sp.]
MSTSSVIPVPVSMTPGPGVHVLTPETEISAPPGPARAVADSLAELLRPPTGFPLRIRPEAGDIALSLDGPGRLGPEGHLLEISEEGVRLRARTAAGLFRGVQTLRQLLPAAVESRGPCPGPWPMAGVRIEDGPRYPWRGVMLDVARHFFDVRAVKRFIDHAVAYKINVLHLHLTDDQGWRLAIDRWPRLADHGGGTEVGGGPGGHYSRRDFQEIVGYAGARHMTVVPEIDVPGHTNAALASYAELNPGDRAPERYTGIEVGFSSLRADKEITYRFLDDVIREVAELTPGPYLHIGGDEAESTDPADYSEFLTRAQRIVRAHGKTVVAWQDAASSTLAPGTLVQYWRPAKGSEPDTRPARAAVAQGARLIMSPADHAYLDLKYHPGTALGLDWAGCVEVRKSYSWDPAALVDGVGEEHIAGVEAALWTETIAGDGDLDFMAFPRLPGIAEIGWSPAGHRVWESYAPRLAAHGRRWDAAGIAFYRSPQIDWPG